MASIAMTINFDENLFNRVKPEYEAGNYTSAIKTAILFLTEEIRERTDLDSDGDSLVTRALSEKNPLIRVNKLETETDMSEQMGYMLMLQGLYKAIRNPRNHNLKEDNKESCEDILVIVNYFLKLVTKAKLKFDFIEICDSIKDKHFDCCAKYSSEIVKKIPEAKYLEVAQKTLETIDDFPVDNIAWTLFSMKKELKGDSFTKFIALLDGLLQKTNSINMVRASTIVLQDDWKKIAVLTQMRLEKILADSLKNMKICWETSTDENGNYCNYQYLDENGITATYIKYLPHRSTEKLNFPNMKTLIEAIFQRGDEYIEYLFEHFDQYLVRDNNHINEAFDEAIIEQLNKQSIKLFLLLSSGCINNGEFYPVYEYGSKIDNAIKRLKKSN